MNAITALLLAAIVREGKTVLHTTSVRSKQVGWSHSAKTKLNLAQPLPFVQIFTSKLYTSDNVSVLYGILMCFTYRLKTKLKIYVSEVLS